MYYLYVSSSSKTIYTKNDKELYTAIYLHCLAVQSSVYAGILL